MAGQQHPPQDGSTMGDPHRPPSPAAPRGCFWVLLQTGPGVEPPRHTPVSICSSQDKQSFAIYQLHELSFSFHNCKSHSFIHLLDTCVGSVCWVHTPGTPKASKGDKVQPSWDPGSGGRSQVKHAALYPTQSSQISSVTYVMDGEERPEFATGAGILLKTS